MLIRIIAVILIFAFSTTDMSAAVCETFQVNVKVGNSAKVDKLGMTIKFVEVVEDSRCPEGAQCIWAGQARVKIQVDRYHKTLAVFVLNLNEGKNSAEYGDQTITFKSLEPYPNAHKPSDPKTYTATFTVVSGHRNG